MAILDSGTLGGLPTADECRGHPSLAQSFGIDEPSRLPNGELFPAVPAVQIGSYTYEFYRHPHLFVTDTCEIWKAEYSHLKDYGTKREYDEFHPCYIYAKKIYESYYNALKPQPMGLF